MGNEISAMLLWNYNHESEWFSATRKLQEIDIQWGKKPIKLFNRLQLFGNSFQRVLSEYMLTCILMYGQDCPRSKWLHIYESRKK